MEVTDPSPAEVEAYGRSRRRWRVAGVILGPAVGVGMADVLCVVHQSTHTDLHSAFVSAGTVIGIAWFAAGRDTTGADAAVLGGALRARSRR